MPESTLTFDSNESHNRNCYLYLRVLGEKMTPELWELLQNYSQISDFEKRSASDYNFEKRSASDYNNEFAYADLYSSLLKYLEDNVIKFIDYAKRIEQDLETNKLRIEFCKMDASDKIKILDRIKTLEDKKSLLEVNKSALHEFFYVIYANDNNNLKLTFDAFKFSVPKDQFSSLKKSMIFTPSVNKTKMPVDVGSFTGRAHSTVTRNFKPQQETSHSTIRHYPYQVQHNRPIEIRCGTQGQRHEGNPRVSPLFEQFLDSLKYKFPQHPSPIHHIYFNNLGLFRDLSHGIEGKNEKELTLALHGLEDSHDNIAVITLPADEFLMDSDRYKETKVELDYQPTLEEMFKIATHEDSLEQIKHDFYISPKIKAMLYQGSYGQYSRETEETTIRNLLTKSFNAMGIIDGSQKLSQSQKQAVWFHFIKFELTDYIIEQLKPIGFNIACKDAIDRAGVASAYYNLLKSISLNSPLTREEFDCGIHAAPVMVKGRPINHQINTLWNAVNTYINVSKTEVTHHPKQQWLIEWRDDNKPLTKPFLETCVEQITLIFHHIASNSVTTHPYFSQFVAVLKMIAGAILAALSLVSSAGNHCYTDLFKSGLSTFKEARKVEIETESDLDKRSFSIL